MYIKENIYIYNFLPIIYLYQFKILWKVKKLVWHLTGKKLFALKILDFSETQIKGEHPRGVPTIFTETLQIFALCLTKMCAFPRPFLSLL